MEAVSKSKGAAGSHLTAGNLLRPTRPLIEVYVLQASQTSTVGRGSQQHCIVIRKMQSIRVLGFRGFHDVHRNVEAHLAIRANVLVEFFGQSPLDFIDCLVVEMKAGKGKPPLHV